MARYKVNRYWAVGDQVTVEARSVTEAISKAHMLPLNKHAEYVPDSINSDPVMDVKLVKKGGRHG